MEIRGTLMKIRGIIQKYGGLQHDDAFFPDSKRRHLIEKYQMSTPCSNLK